MKNIKKNEINSFSIQNILNSIVQNDSEIQEVLLQIENDDIIQILKNPKKFIFNVWKMNIVKGVNVDTNINFDEINIKEFFNVFFNSSEEFYQYYSIYKKRENIHNNINNINNIISNLKNI